MAIEMRRIAEARQPIDLDEEHPTPHWHRLDRRPGQHCTRLGHFVTCSEHMVCARIIARSGMPPCLMVSTRQSLPAPLT